jgi:hypothetical protein
MQLNSMKGEIMKKRRISSRTKRNLLLGLISFALIVGICLFPLFSITWGELDNERHPNVGCISADIPGWGLYQMGSCTLIAENVVLTAGHVTAALNYYISIGLFSIADVKVSFDDDNVYDPTTWNAAAGLVTHPAYYFPASGASHQSHDIGAVILGTSVGIEPVTLAEVGLLDGLKQDKAVKGGPKSNQLIAVGYGTQLEWPPPQTIPPDGARYLAECGYQALNSQWLLCSQNNTLGLGGTGYGDSGGPAFWRLPDDTEVQVGITCWGDMPLVSTTWFFRVDTPEARGFIDGVIGTAKSLMN